MAQGTKVPYFVIKNQTVITKDHIRKTSDGAHQCYPASSSWMSD